MTRHRSPRGAWVIVVALVAVACGGGADRTAAGVDQTPAAPSATEDPTNASDLPDTDDQHDMTDMTAAEHADMDQPEDDQDTVAAARPRTTEATLAALAEMDPARLAGLHDHDDAEHVDHGGPSLPNGIDPERLVIPTIGVDADVIDLGLQDDGSMEVPTDFAQTGWFTPGPKPGRVGPAVIAGHVDSRTGPAVFFRLTELEVGDQIEVHDGAGEIVTFAVRGMEQHPKDDFPTERVYAGTPGPELRLITCGGSFDSDAGSYRDNVIVYAERVEV